MAETVFKFGGMLLISVLAFLGVYFLKITLNKTIPAGSNMQAMLRIMPYVALELKFWLAVACYAAAMVVYLFLLQGDEVSRIFSVAVGFNVLLTALGAALLLGDTINLARGVGILLISAGIFLIQSHG